MKNYQNERERARVERNPMRVREGGRKRDCCMQVGIL